MRLNYWTMPSRNKDITIQRGRALHQRGTQN
jgi:hypothetical protein